MFAPVSIIKCNEYDVEKLRLVIRGHFKHIGGIEKFISSGKKVLIKPNLVLAKSPDKAATTHPAYIEALAAEIIEAGGEVVIADSPGGPFTTSLLSMVYRVSGMDKAAKNSGATLNLDVGAKVLHRQENKICHSFNIISPYHNCDVLITVAKLKTHAMAAYSGAVKNLFGLIPGLEKPEFHFRYQEKETFCKMIVDLCETAKPHLSFIDGILAHEGNGPTGGTPREAGLSFAGVNPHCVDLAGAAVIGLSSKEVYTLSEAAERGLCPTEASALEILGEKLEEVLIKDYKQAQTRSLEFTKFLPEPIKKIVDKMATPKPVIQEAGCIGCGKCAESCPMKTISLENQKAHINYDNCIKCFCCQEMCPVKAIRIKRLQILTNRR